jgi:hypothetical protein
LDQFWKQACVTGDQRGDLIGAANRPPISALQKGKDVFARHKDDPTKARSIPQVLYATKMLPYERRRAKPRGLLIVAGAETR